MLVTARAARQVKATVRWWSANRPKAPGAVRQDFAEVIELIAAQPEIGTAARSARLPGVRRIHLDRIRYYVYYRAIASPPHVQVLVLWHSSRGKEPRI